MISESKSRRRLTGNVAIAWVVLILSAMSCQSTKEVAPLSLEQMKSLMLDVQLAETYALDVTNKDTAFKGEKINGRNSDTLVKYYTSILQHHRLTTEQFFQAIDWYLRHPQDLDSVYVKMLPAISEVESKLSVPGN